MPIGMDTTPTMQAVRFYAKGDIRLDKIPIPYVS